MTATATTFRVTEQNKAYTAFGAAKQLWSCRDEEILMEGPAGTGKTRAILEKIVFCCMKYPRTRALLVRKTRESITTSVLVTLEDKVFAAGSPALEGPQRNLRQVYRFPNGSEIDIGGMDKPTKIMSTDYDIIGTFETTELTEEDFENLTTRLRNWKMPYQQIIADCNPGAPTHWLNRRPDKTGMVRLLSRHEDNPMWFDPKSKNWTEQGHKYLKKLDRLSGHRRARLRFGKWVAAEGQVYDVFDVNIHLITRFDPPPEWPRIRAIDFGYKSPFVCQWWALDRDRRMYMYREIYITHRTVGAILAPRIKELSGNERYLATICDHNDEARATLEENGIFSHPAYKDIERGIQAVHDRMKPYRDGKPRIFVMKDITDEYDEELRDENRPLCTAQEFDAYMYKKTEDGKPIKEEPVDKDNHGMDAMRYAVAYVDDLRAMTLTVTGEKAVGVYV